MAVTIDPRFMDQALALGATNAQRAWDFYKRYAENPAHPGFSLERLERLKTSDLWSARISDDLRAIIYRDGGDHHIVYCDHHDAAYRWASRFRVGRHPTTNAIQVYSAPEEVDVPPPRRAEPAPGAGDPVPRQGLLDHHADAYLVSLGLPENWLPVIREVEDQDQLLEVVGGLPADVGEALIRVGLGELVAPPAPAPSALTLDTVAESPDGMISPDIDDIDRLVAAPMSVWIAFLHPTQRRLATADFSGPAKVTGTAGTGKSVVGMHRARHLARQGRRVLLTSYVNVLCENLDHNLGLLCTDEERSRIDVRTIHQVASDLARQARRSPAKVIGDDEVRDLIERFVKDVACPLGRSALLAEWNLVVQPQGIEDWEGYRAANRAGRGTPLTVADRKVVWGVLGRVREHLDARGLTDWQGLCRIAREEVEQGVVAPAWDSVIVDEVQDLSAQALRLAAVLGGSGPNGLTVVGDGGQRIYAHRTSLRAIGVETRGRSRVLKINYRTTEQIRRFADRILRDADDLDDERVRRDDTRSVRAGQPPHTGAFASQAEQYEYVAEHVRDCIADGAAPAEIAVFARTKKLLEGVERHLRALGVECSLLQPHKPPLPDDVVRLVTFHSAKGLEFKQGIAVDVSADRVPNTYSVRSAGDEQDRAEAIGRERQLLYVALTRARDHMLVTWVKQPSPFLAPALTAPTVTA